MHLYGCINSLKAKPRKIQITIPPVIVLFSSTSMLLKPTPFFHPVSDESNKVLRRSGLNVVYQSAQQGSFPWNVFPNPKSNGQQQGKFWGTIPNVPRSALRSRSGNFRLYHPDHVVVAASYLYAYPCSYYNLLSLECSQMNQRGDVYSFSKAIECKYFTEMEIWILPVLRNKDCVVQVGFPKEFPNIQ